MILCDYGCGREGKFQFKNGKWCCNTHHNRCQNIRQKISMRMKEEWEDPNSIFGTEECNNKRRESMMGKNINDKNGMWKGGTYNWLHAKARELFGQDTCEVCGMTNEEHLKKTGKSLHMHCDGKRYRNMERIFWTTCCHWCHAKIELLDKED